MIQKLIGTNTTSNIFGSVSVPKVTPSQKYLTATSSAPEVTRTAVEPIISLDAPITTTTLTSVTVATPTITLTETNATNTGVVPVISGVTVTSESKSFTSIAAAQTWTQKTGVIGSPTIWDLIKI